MRQPHRITEAQLRLLPEEIQNNLVIGPDCWTWLGRHNEDDRPMFSNKMAHRVLYELLVSPIQGRLHLHHKCGNKCCVNPLHMEALTPSAHQVEHGRLRSGGIVRPSSEEKKKLEHKERQCNLDLHQRIADDVHISLVDGFVILNFRGRQFAPDEIIQVSQQQSEFASMAAAYWGLSKRRTEEERDMVRLYLAQSFAADAKTRAARITGGQKKRVMAICPHCGQMADARHRAWRQCITGNRGGLKEIVK